MGKRIVIVGAGAVGGYTGAHMAKAGEDVTYIDSWPEHVEEINRNGFHITHHQGPEPFSVKVRALHLTEAQHLAKEAPVDIAFVCMKSYDTQWAAQLIKQYLAPSGYVVSLQNCMNEATIAEVVGWGRTLGCIASNISVHLHAPGRINRGGLVGGSRHTVYRTGEVHGRMTERAQEVCRLVSHADSAKATDNLWGERWSKLVANSSANGVSACTGLAGAQLTENDTIRHFQARLASEAIRIGQRLGYKLEEIGHQDPELIARAGEGDAAARRAPVGSAAWLGRAAPLDGPGHGEGKAHRDRVLERLCRARGRKSRTSCARQRAPRRDRQESRARRTPAGPAPHHRIAAQLGGGDLTRLHSAARAPILLCKENPQVGRRMVDDVKEAKPLSVTIRTADDQLHSGYLIGTPRPPRRAFHQMLALLAIAGLILAGVGLVVSIITTAAWAGLALIVGLGIFCVAGYLAEPTAQGG